VAEPEKAARSEAPNGLLGLQVKMERKDIADKVPPVIGFVK
jgi:hypothetical protein